MNKRFIVLLALLLTLGMMAYAQGGLKTSTNSRVNLRSGPGVEWRIVGTAQPNTTVLLDGQAFGGSWVRGITSTGIIGWMFTQNLNLPQDQAASLPPVLIETPFSLSAPAQEGPIGGAADVQAPPEAPSDTTGSSPAPANVRPAATGAFNLGGHIRYFSDNTFNFMRTAGMSWIKTQVRWEPGADPNGPGGMIDSAHGNGFKIVLGIVGNAGRVNEPGYFEAYAQYVAGVAARGADAIEVWNEPNIDREWASGSIDPARYTELLRQSYAAIKAANPATLVISGAPAPTGFFGGCSGAGCDDNLYIQGMARAGAANYMDCVGVHYNEGIVPPTATRGDPRGNPNHYTRYYQTMVNTYWSAFRGARPLCFTELGYLTPEGYGPLPPGFDWASNVTVGQQASWLDQVVGMARRSGRVKLLIVWNVDFDNYGADPMAGFAMIRPGNVCPACDALAR
jgi:hypothetical protein